MENNRQILTRTSLFKGLSEEQLDRINMIASHRQYQKGESIFSEGDEGDGFYIVMEGSVKIYKVSMDGKEQILHICGPGQPFGEVPVFSGDNFPANAEAIQNTRLLFIPRSAFIRLLADNPSLAMNMLGILSLRLRQFTVQVENLSLKEVPGRLASYLNYLSGEQGETVGVQLPISKGQLASLLGTIPETLSRIFSKMSEYGLIEVDGPHITILDEAGLEELAEHGKL
jgi:CRP/FNR family transcriptional regulator